MNRDTDDSRWHLDKKVPISIIAALFIQFLGGVWFMSKLESRLVTLESTVASAKAMQERIDDRQDERASEAVGLVRSDIQELGRKLDRLVERTPK